jgi:hypothetical protein
MRLEGGKLCSICTISPSATPFRNGAVAQMAEYPHSTSDQYVSNYLITDQVRTGWRKRCRNVYAIPEHSTVTQRQNIFSSNKQLRFRTQRFGDLNLHRIACS